MNALAPQNLVSEINYTLLELLCLLFFDLFPDKKYRRCQDVIKI